MSPSLQVKILRAIQEGIINRVGSHTNININIRFIAATNKNLFEEVQNGGFREDLYYRLNVVHIHIPSLRERRDDILVLAQHFLDKYSEKKEVTFSIEVLKILIEYHWPGNVRELENAIQRAVIMRTSNVLEPKDLPPIISIHNTKKLETRYYSGLPLKKAVSKFKRELIVHTLINNNWSVKNTAVSLGIHSKYLSRLITANGIIRGVG